MQRSTLNLSLIFALLLVACSDSEQSRLSSTELNERKVSKQLDIDSGNRHQQIVATIDNEPVLMTQIDSSIQLKLFDLEWHKYQLRKAALETAVASKVEQQLTKSTAPHVEILLTPPAAPRFFLPDTDKPIKGDPDAVVKLSLFCSFQSSHCARLQPELRELEARYGELINLVFYDLPQTFHRYGKAAANANLCAAESGSQWAYQEALYSNINQLNRERYLIIANQLGVDSKSFSQCIDHNQYQDKLDSDQELAQRLGLGNVPVLFVNGLYTKGANTADGYGYYINQELIRLGLAIPTTLPLRLVSTSVKDPTEDSRAKLQDLNNQTLTEYKHGDGLNLVGRGGVNLDVTLTAIESQRVLLNNNGQKEFLRLNQGPDKPATVSITPASNSSRESSVSREPSSAQVQRFEQLPTTAKMQLSKNWLSKHLQNKQKLAQHFQATEHQIEGVHLLKLTDIDRNEFYKTLGLQSGDVVLQANNQWVHEGSNPLWDALGQNEITLLVMREGLPLRFDYKTKQ
ncbi:thioredoxin domain-containing protein [Shewanella woodyi]|uniref:thioredoxin domain-containing protein n=1 Tax=Shewanella woodyi TaxID=60961 RepID=UPI00374A9479